jgi:hypothetical protein
MLAPPQLDVLLGEFAGTETARACARPAGAYANCLAASALCARWLRANGVACGLLHLAGSRTELRGRVGRWPVCDPAGVEHWTIWSGPWSIDWTARQFRRDAPWPLVEPIEALAVRWRTVEVWACERCPEVLGDERHAALAPAALHREHRAIARASGGVGPFPDPRHDGTTPLVRLCLCDQSATPQNRIAATAMT